MRWFALFLLLWSSATRAQLLSQIPPGAYEGQAVSSVSLIANPHRDLEPLYPFVSQKAGEPYSESKVQATIAALEKNGGFPKVEVNVTPDISGLRLNFILEPAYYLGVVDFGSLQKYFSYTRLLQVANLPDEDAYDKARIPVAEAALRNFLQRNGYFQAKVSSRSDIDDAAQLVHVSFVVEIGSRPALEKLEFRDRMTPRPPACSAALALHAPGLREGC